MKRLFLVFTFACLLFSSGFPQSNYRTLLTIDSLAKTNLPTLSLKENVKLVLNQNRRNKKIIESNIISQIFLVDTIHTYSSNGESRTIYSYSSDGIIIKALVQNLNGDTWENFSQDSISIDNSGNTLFTSYSLWQNQSWVTQWKYSYTYDSNGMIEQIMFENTINNILTKVFLDTYNYSGDFLQSMTEQKWQDNQWENISTDEYTNDSQGNLLTDTHESFPDSNRTRETYTYNNESKVLTQLYESWDGNWINKNRLTNSYDENGNQLTILNEKWTNNSWVGVARVTNTYNSANKILTFHTEIYDTINSNWINNGLSISTYDINNNLISYISKSWLNGQWVDNYYYDYTYDNNNSLLTLTCKQNNNGAVKNVWQQSYKNDSTGQTIQGEYFSWQGSSWVSTDGSLNFTDGLQRAFGFYASKFTVTYKSSITSAKDNPILSDKYSLSQNYPNPFNPSTVISYRLSVGSIVSLKIFDILGREVATLVNENQQTGNYEVTFDASKLSSGIYFYKLQAGFFVETKKMILIK